jgi:uncharacterized protein (TIGR03084 family)
MPNINELRADLAKEHQSLAQVVAALESEAWATATPADGWDIRDTVSHLCYFDEAAVLAISEGPAFEAHKAALAATAQAGLRADIAIGRSSKEPARLLSRWEAAHLALMRAVRRAADLTEPSRVPWYGPAMSLASFVSARIMETWAHGVDIRDGLGRSLEPVNTVRLKHICHIAYRARAFTFAVHGVTDTASPVAFHVSAPDGSLWTWGPRDCPERICGSALDLALVFTQRRHPDRTAIEATGATALTWLSIAQAFAGPPTTVDIDRY